MLHTGILPHHTNWANFFRNLKYVVIDELHTYRGVFGSHVANVIRRLKRVATFYGANPQFILTSATIGNPQELAEKLVEAPVVLIDEDGSSRGERHFLIYNPPLVDEAQKRPARKRASGPGCAVCRGAECGVCEIEAECGDHIDIPARE
jgi:DEAD/DEAH box helicase domain-containing protein